MIFYFWHLWFVPVLSTRALAQILVVSSEPLPTYTEGTCANTAAIRWQDHCMLIEAKDAAATYLCSVYVHNRFNNFGKLNFATFLLHYPNLRHR